MKLVYDRKNFDPHESIGALIGRTRKAMIQKIDAELAPLEVSAAQWLIVLLVGQDGAGSAAELCELLGYDPGAMTRLLDRLEEKGVVRRVRDDGDRRTVRLELTASGKALYPKILAAMVDVFNRLLHGFSRSEVDELEGYLKRMLANA
jgi:MarR family transcriptional regulator, multiple antibiotic resistance protein MarR